MKSLIPALSIAAILALLSGCAISMNIRARARTDQEVVDFHARIFSTVSRIYRPNNDSLMDRLVPYGIDQINFINVYTKTGQLNQSTADGSCEFATLTARDQVLRVSKPQEKLTEVLKVIHPVAGQPVGSGKPVILFGYARYIRKVPMMKSRMKLLRQRLTEVDTSVYDVAALCLDPIR